MRDVLYETFPDGHEEMEWLPAKDEWVAHPSERNEYGTVVGPHAPDRQIGPRSRSMTSSASRTA